MSELITEIISDLALAVVFLAMGLLIGANIAADSLHKEAIQRGYAIHNPTNGVWQWKEAK